LHGNSIPVLWLRRCRAAKLVEKITHAAEREGIEAGNRFKGIGIREQRGIVAAG
jgi:hypothetical protein